MGNSLEIRGQSIRVYGEAPSCLRKQPCDPDIDPAELRQLKPVNQRCNRKPAGGFTLLELLVAVAIVIVLAAISFQVFTNMVQSANLTRATNKIKDLGQAFVDYTTDHGGRLPLENADIRGLGGRCQ